MNFYLIGVNVNVTIVTDPPGIPVTGTTDTFDYTILTRVNMTCNVTTPDGSPVTATSYRWTGTNCYTGSSGVSDPCFYDGQTGQSITDSNGVLAPDAGTVTCTATVAGVNYTSEPLTLRISGEELIKIMRKSIYLLLLCICIYMHKYDKKEVVITIKRENN